MNLPTFSTTITQKGQITLPKSVRDLLGLAIGERIGLTVVDPKQKHVQLKPVRSLSSLSGKYRVKNPKDPMKVRELMEKQYQRV